MERYIKYKDSGIDWIGEIPIEWRMPKIAYLTSKVGSGKTPSGGSDVYVEEGVMFLRSQNVYDEGLVIDSVSHISPEIDEGMKNTRVCYGDVLLNITGGSIGRCCIFDLNNTSANVNQHVCIIRVNSDAVLNSYMRYFWISGAGKAVVSYVQTGGNREGLNFEQIKNTRMPLPDFGVQEKIVTHLDRKTAQIDRLIADKENLIALLKEKRQATISEAVTKGLDPTAPMKDSGIDWIGEIPAHWEIVPLFALAQENRERNVGNQNENLLSLSYGKIINKDINTNLGLLPESFEGYQIVHPGYIVLRLTDLQNDKRSLRTGFVEQCGIITSAYTALIPSNRVNSRFLADLLHAYDLMKIFYNLGNGVRQSMNYKDLRRLPIVLPPIDEQLYLSEKLKIATDSLDKNITLVYQQLNLLKEYRQAIISEAVTGKHIVPTETAQTEEKPARQANIHFKRRVLAAKILDELCEEPTLGHVKLEKLLFLSEYCAQLDLETQYGRHAAGPYNPKVLRSIDSQLKKAKWFEYSPKPQSSNKYVRMADCKEYQPYYENYFDEAQREKVDVLLRLFKSARTISSEIVATLYGAWNDFLLEGASPTDDEIITEVLSNWHEDKERISHVRWQRALDWMRKNRIIPQGYGKSTKGGNI